MEELIAYLEESAQDVDGVRMVPLEIALSVANTAKSITVLHELDQTVSGLYQSLVDISKLDEDNQEV